jgi:hypothetical protein
VPFEAEVAEYIYQWLKREGSVAQRIGLFSRSSSLWVWRKLGASRAACAVPLTRTTFGGLVPFLIGKNFLVEFQLLDVLMSISISLTPTVPDTMRRH